MNLITSKVHHWRCEGCYIIHEETFICALATSRCDKAGLCRDIYLRIHARVNHTACPPVQDPLPIHRQSFYLFGRERRVADIPTDHPSCSKQHAVLQFRWNLRPPPMPPVYIRTTKNLILMRIIFIVIPAG